MRKHWNMNQLADETLMDRRTLKKILSETKPATSDGKSDFYYLADFMSAYSAYVSPRESQDERENSARLLKYRADIAEVKRAKALGEVIETDAAFRFFENFIVPVKRIIELSHMTTQEKDSVFKQLSTINKEQLVNAALQQQVVTDESSDEDAEPILPAGEDSAEHVGGSL